MLMNILRLIWPFVKEMIIGKNSLRYAIRRNKVKVFFFFTVILSFILNWIVIPKLFYLSASHVEIEKKLKVCQEASVLYESDIQNINELKKALAVAIAKNNELESNKNKNECTELIDHEHDVKIEHDVIYVNNMAFMVFYINWYYIFL